MEKDSLRQRLFSDKDSDEKDEAHIIQPMLVLDPILFFEVSKTLSPSNVKKLGKIYSCLAGDITYNGAEEMDLWELRLMALSNGGLVHPEVRKIAWLKLLGIPDQGDIDPLTEPLLKERQDVPRDERRTIEQDVGRSVWRLEGKQLEKIIEHAKAEHFLPNDNYSDNSILEATILSALRQSPVDLHYYQGFHDIASLILLNVHSPTLSAHILSKISSHHLVDYMQETFRGTMSLLQIGLWVLLGQMDEELLRHLQDTGIQLHGYTLSWVIGWFSHDIKDFSTASRIMDVCIASHPSMPIYLSATMLLSPSNRYLILNTDSDIAAIHMVIQKLPKFILTGDSPDGEEAIDQWVDSALALMKTIPPHELISIASRIQDGDILAESLMESSTISMLNSNTPSQHFSLATSAPATPQKERPNKMTEPYENPSVTLNIQQFEKDMNSHRTKKKRKESFKKTLKQKSTSTMKRQRRAIIAAGKYRTYKNILRRRERAQKLKLLIGGAMLTICVSGGVWYINDRGNQIPLNTSIPSTFPSHSPSTEDSKPLNNILANAQTAEEIEHVQIRNKTLNPQSSKSTTNEADELNEVESLMGTDIFELMKEKPEISQSDDRLDSKGTDEDIEAVGNISEIINRETLEKETDTTEILDSVVTDVKGSTTSEILNKEEIDTIDEMDGTSTDVESNTEPVDLVQAEYDDNNDTTLSLKLLDTNELDTNTVKVESDSQSIEIDKEIEDHTAHINESHDSVAINTKETEMALADMESPRATIDEDQNDNENDVSKQSESQDSSVIVGKEIDMKSTQTVGLDRDSGFTSEMLNDENDLVRLKESRGIEAPDSDKMDAESADIDTIAIDLLDDGHDTNTSQESSSLVTNNVNAKEIELGDIESRAEPIDAAIETDAIKPQISLDPETSQNLDLLRDEIFDNDNQIEENIPKEDILSNGHTTREKRVNLSMEEVSEDAVLIHSEGLNSEHDIENQNDDESTMSSPHGDNEKGFRNLGNSAILHSLLDAYGDDLFYVDTLGSYDEYKRETSSKDHKKDTGTKFKEHDHDVDDESGIHLTEADMEMYKMTNYLSPSYIIDNTKKDGLTTETINDSKIGKHIETLTKAEEENPVNDDGSEMHVSKADMEMYKMTDYIPSHSFSDDQIVHPIDSNIEANEDTAREKAETDKDDDDDSELHLSKADIEMYKMTDYISPSSLRNLNESPTDDIDNEDESELMTHYIRTLSVYLEIATSLRNQSFPYNLSSWEFFEGMHSNLKDHALTLKTTVKDHVLVAKRKQITQAITSAVQQIGSHIGENFSGEKLQLKIRKQKQISMEIASKLQHDVQCFSSQVSGKISKGKLHLKSIKKRETMGRGIRHLKNHLKEGLGKHAEDIIL